MAERLRAAPALDGLTRDNFATRYDALSAVFAEECEPGERAAFREDVDYHRDRYVDLLSREYQGRVLDVGNDKPFLAFLLAHLNPDAAFDVMALAAPPFPTDLHEIDVEAEVFPFPAATFDHVILAEVIEHLWRDPSWCIHEINRVAKPGAGLFLTTPNPCERHAITCALWQANPNQRSQYYPGLEMGHVHLWTTRDLQTILDAHGFEVTALETRDFYGYTQDVEAIAQLIRAVSPTPELMGEAIVVRARKVADSVAPCYPRSIFPYGAPVQRERILATLARAPRR